MAVIARDVYEIVVKGGLEAKDLLASMNALLEEDRKRWADVAKVLGSVEDALKGLNQGQREAQQGLGETTSKLLSVDAASNLLVKSWGLVRKAGEALAKPIGLATSFETEIAAIDTISNRAGTRFATTFLDISERLGIDAALVARAGYDAVGSGVAEAILPQFTEIAGKLAIAGRAEIGPTLSLLTTLQNQFGLSVDGIAKASDILFAVTKVGVTTIPELASELGALIPVAKGAGLSLEEIGGAVAALTRAGVSTSESTTQIRSLAVSLSTDSPKIIKAFNAVGVSITEGQFKALSFTEKVVLLSKSFADNQGPLINALGRIEAVNGAMLLGANNGAALSDSLKEIGKSAGATNVAVGIMQETTEQAAARLKATFNRQLIELGNQLLPKVNEVMTQLTEYIKANGDELAAKIKGGVDSLISLGTWVVDHGPEVLTFFGALVAGQLLGGLVSMGRVIVGVVSALGFLPAAAGAASAAFAFINPLTIAVAGLTAGVLALREAWIGATSVGLGGAGGALNSFVNSIDLDVRTAQARIDRAQQRNAVGEGGSLLTNPAEIDRATGEFTGRLEGGVATLQEALALGLDTATKLVEDNVQALASAAAVQRLRFEDAGAKVEASQAEFFALTQEIDGLLQEQARGNLLVNQQLTIAVNRRAEVETEIAQLHETADEARRKAAELEIARANISAKFQAEVTGRLLAEFKGIGTRVVGALNASALARAQAPKPTGRGGGARRPETDIEGELEAKAIEARAEIITAGLARLQSAASVDAERRIALIRDTNTRELALLQRRHDEELTAAAAAGQDLNLLLQTQGLARLDVLRSQEEAAAQVRTQAAADFRTQLDRNQQIEAQLLGDTDEGAIIALMNRQETELALFEGNMEAQQEIQRFYGDKITELVERQNDARMESYLTTAESIAGVFSGLAGVVEAFGLKSNLFTGLAIVAEAIYLQAKAITYGIRAAGAALDLDPRAFGFAAIALQAQAGAVKQYALAAQLGASGGGGGGGARVGGGGGAPRRNPRLEGGGGEGKDRAPITFVFQGPVYDTRQAAESAFGRQALRGIRRVEDAPRGAPRANFSSFQR